MLYHNQFNVDPGTYFGDDGMVVVSDIITHAVINGVHGELEDPLVVFRKKIDIKKHERFQIKLSEFKKTYRR